MGIRRHNQGYCVLAPPCLAHDGVVGDTLDARALPQSGIEMFLGKTYSPGIVDAYSEGLGAHPAASF